MIQFSVIDNSIGIAPQDLRKLFTPFVQVDSNLDCQHEGTGLGLALVQKLIDLHGGSVQVESEVGKGSRFTINLPGMKDLVAQQEIIESGRALLTPSPDISPSHASTALAPSQGSSFTSFAGSTVYIR